MLKFSFNFIVSFFSFTIFSYITIRNSSQLRDQGQTSSFTIVQAFVLDLFAFLLTAEVQTLETAIPFGIIFLTLAIQVLHKLLILLHKPLMPQGLLFLQSLFSGRKILQELGKGIA